MNTNITKTWSIPISEEDIFARCTNESLYQTYARNAGNTKDDLVVMQEDDRGQFRVYFSVAIANLHMMLARRMEEPSSDYSGGCGGVVFNLQMHDNHDNNILPMLITHCNNYVVKKVLEQWYGINFGSELERLEINHCLHYRKHPVRRRVTPLF